LAPALRPSPAPSSRASAWWPARRRRRRHTRR
jgi:hypothetical protein